MLNSSEPITRAIERKAICPDENDKRPQSAQQGPRRTIMCPCVHVRGRVMQKGGFAAGKLSCLFGVVRSTARFIGFDRHESAGMPGEKRCSES